MSMDSTKKIIGDLLRRYESSYVRPFVDLLPGVDATLYHFRLQRLHAFFDELAKGNIDLTEEQIENEDFLHAYYATVRAVANTRRREKIRLFALLFVNYIQNGDLCEDNTDVFDEVLAILDDLSYREFQILTILHSFETTLLPDKDENPERWISHGWDDFLSAVASELGIPSDHIQGMLARLNRTGLYETITGTFFGYRGGGGHLTPNFATFMDALNEKYKCGQEDRG